MCLQESKNPTQKPQVTCAVRRVHTAHKTMSVRRGAKNAAAEATDAAFYELERRRRATRCRAAYYQTKEGVEYKEYKLGPVAATPVASGASCNKRQTRGATTLPSRPGKAATRTCPGRHGLALFVAPPSRTQYIACDACQACLRVGDPVWTCVRCEFDSCESCYYDNSAQCTRPSAQRDTAWRDVVDCDAGKSINTGGNVTFCYQRPEHEEDPKFYAACDARRNMTDGAIAAKALASSVRTPAVAVAVPVDPPYNPEYAEPLLHAVAVPVNK